MITYFKMKKKEHELKLTLYSSIQNFVENKSDIFETLNKVYIACKDTPVDELQNKLIGEIAKLIHEDSDKENNNEE